MNPDMYAQLHGLARAPKTTAGEQDMAMKDYIDLLLEEEKEDFQEGLETFEAHAEKRRLELKEAMQEFYDRYTNGLKTISDALVAQGLERPEVPEENLQVFDDPDQLLEAVESGRPLYELLGFTLARLLEFYKVLNTLYAAEKYQDVKDGFFFLITCAPDNATFWCGLGVVSCKLQEYDKAQDAFLEALELDPTSKEAYLGCVHAYLKQDKAQEAEELCDSGIALAQENSDEPWAQDLEMTLVEAKNVLKSDQH